MPDFYHGYGLRGGHRDTVCGYLRTPDGVIQPFDAPGASAERDENLRTLAVANNDFGLVTGYSVDKNNGCHGFVRFRSGSIRVLDVRAAGAGNGRSATRWAINLSGQIAEATQTQIL